MKPFKMAELGIGVLFASPLTGEVFTPLGLLLIADAFGVMR